MEEAGHEDLMHEGAGASGGEVAGGLGGERGGIGGAADDEVHNEEAAGGEIGDDVGREDAGRGGVEGVEELLVAGFVAEIEFALDAFGDGFDYGGEVEGVEGSDALVELVSEQGGEFEIGVDGAHDIGALDFHGDGAPIAAEAGEIDLSEGGGGGGLFGELGEDLLGLGLEFFDEDLADGFVGNGGDVVLKFTQLEDEGGGDDIGPHGEELAELDPGGAELLAGEADAFPAAALAGLVGDEAPAEGPGQV